MVLPVMELILLLEAGRRIGVISTVLVVISTGIAGAALARSQGFSILEKIRRQLESGVMPADEMFDGVLILAGGLVLLTPGFITDTAGFLLLIPGTRGIIKRFIKKRVKPVTSPPGEYIDVDPL